MLTGSRAPSGCENRQGWRKGDTQVLVWRLNRTGFSVGPDGDIIPEDRIGGGPDLLSLLGSQSGFQLVGKQVHRREAWLPLPEIEMREDLAD